MIKAWFAGFFILFFISVVWELFLFTKEAPIMMFWLMNMAPFIAGVMVALMAPRNKLLMSLSMAIPWAILSVLLNIIDQLLGVSVDFPGVKGGVILFVVVLIYSVIVCALGSIGGVYLSKRRNK